MRPWEDYYLTGEQRDDVLLFNGTMSQEDKDALMEIAENVANPTAWKTANWIAAGIGAVVLVLGALGIFGVFDKRRKRHFTN